MQGSPEGLHGVGTELAHSAEHLQEPVRRLDQAYAESDQDGAPATRQKMDAVAAEVRALEAQMSRTLGALRRAVGYR